MKLKIFFLFFFFLCLTLHKTYGQSVLGKWKTYDIFDKSKEESIVEIYSLSNQLFVKIVEILPEEHKNDLCKRCTGEYKDKPILGLVILKGATLEDGIWKGAPILNAKNGKYYGCHISLENKDVLKVRGFVGYPIFGKTLYWTRVKDRTFR
jgi:uncharacterized protein (DUF2147 family)